MKGLNAVVLFLTCLSGNVLGAPTALKRDAAVGVSQDEIQTLQKMVAVNPLLGDIDVSTLLATLGKRDEAAQAEAAGLPIPLDTLLKILDIIKASGGLGGIGKRDEAAQAEAAGLPIPLDTLLNILDIIKASGGLGGIGKRDEAAQAEDAGLPLPSSTILSLLNILSGGLAKPVTDLAGGVTSGLGKREEANYIPIPLPLGLDKTLPSGGKGAAIVDSPVKGVSETVNNLTGSAPKPVTEVIGVVPGAVGL